MKNRQTGRKCLTDPKYSTSHCPWPKMKSFCSVVPEKSVTDIFVRLRSRQTYRESNEQTDGLKYGQGECNITS